MSSAALKREEEGRGGALLLLPTLSPRARFALKTALAITLSYIGAMALNWDQPYRGPITIMVIAAAGPLMESLGKGVMRVLGTIAGALIGLLFIALYPQDTMIYFLALSLTGAVIIYLYHAWQGDKTFWMIMLMVMILIYNNGEVDDRLIYALDRSWQTAFGIFVYAMVNIFLWPESYTGSRIEKAEELAQSWQEIFEALKKGTKEDLKAEKIHANEEALEQTLRLGATEYPGGIAFDRRRWELLWGPIRQVDASLERLMLLEWPKYSKRLENLLPQSRDVFREIEEMTASFLAFWSRPEIRRIPAACPSDKEYRLPEELPLLDRAQLTSLYAELCTLHSALKKLLETLNRIVSPEPDPAESFAEGRKPSLFHWGDPDDLKATLASLLVFWSGLAVWYFFNVPEGYKVAALGFSLSLLIFFTPLNPLALILIFSLSFFVSFVTYVWMLPQLHEWWELTLYIFLYMFAAYYFIPTQLALFFAMGLVFQFIENTMSFNFQLFIMILLIFYLFLGLLLIFNYLPFPNRPERLFLTLESRFRKLALPLIEGRPGVSNLWWRWRRKRALAHLPRTLAKMKLWASEIDRKYFDALDEEKLAAYLKSVAQSVRLFALIEPLKHRLEQSEIVKDLGEVIEREGEFVREFLERIERDHVEPSGWVEQEATRFDAVVRRIDWERFDRQEISDLTEYAALRKQLFTTLIEAMRVRREIGLEQLKWSRF